MLSVPQGRHKNHPEVRSLNIMHVPQPINLDPISSHSEPWGLWMKWVDWGNTSKPTNAPHSPGPERSWNPQQSCPQHPEDRWEGSGCSLTHPPHHSPSGLWEGPSELSGGPGDGRKVTSNRASGREHSSKPCRSPSFKAKKHPCPQGAPTPRGRPWPYLG